MALDLDLIVRYVEKEFNKVTFDVAEQTDTKLVLTASEVSAAKYFDDDIYVRVVCYDSGTLHVFFTFDQLRLDSLTSRLINDFNDNVPFLKALVTTIKDKQYLQIHAVNVGCESERVVASTVSFFFGELLDDTTLEFLTPLTDLTI